MPCHCCVAQPQPRPPSPHTHLADSPHHMCMARHPPIANVPVALHDEEALCMHIATRVPRRLQPTTPTSSPAGVWAAQGAFGHGKVSALGPPIYLPGQGVMQLPPRDVQEASEGAVRVTTAAHTHLPCVLGSQYTLPTPNRPCSLASHIMRYTVPRAQPVSAGHHCRRGRSTRTRTRTPRECAWAPGCAQTARTKEAFKLTAGRGTNGRRATKAALGGGGLPW